MADSAGSKARGGWLGAGLRVVGKLVLVVAVVMAGSWVVRQGYAWPVGPSRDAVVFERAFAVLRGLAEQPDARVAEQLTALGFRAEASGREFTAKGQSGTVLCFLGDETDGLFLAHRLQSGRPLTPREAAALAAVRDAGATGELLRVYLPPIDGSTLLSEAVEVDLRLARVRSHEVRVVRVARGD